MAAEPKDDGDSPEYVRKIASHLSSSHLEQDLNDFLELHADELRSEIQDSEGKEKDEYSLLIHRLYQDFLGVVQSNLEEFLHAEGLTEAELRTACEQEMVLTGHPEGHNFMHTLISSWEFSSFLALASDFVDEDQEETELEEEEEEEYNDQESIRSGSFFRNSQRERGESVASNESRCGCVVSAGSTDDRDEYSVRMKSDMNRERSRGRGNKVLGGNVAVLGIEGLDTGLPTKPRQADIGVKQQRRIYRSSSSDELPLTQPTWSNVGGRGSEHHEQQDDLICMRAQAKT